MRDEEKAAKKYEKTNRNLKNLSGWIWLIDFFRQKMTNFHQLRCMGAKPKRNT